MTSSPKENDRPKPQYDLGMMRIELGQIDSQIEGFRQTLIALRKKKSEYELIIEEIIRNGGS